MFGNCMTTNFQFSFFFFLFFALALSVSVLVRETRPMRGFYVRRVFYVMRLARGWGLIPWIDYVDDCQSESLRRLSDI